MQPSLIKKIPSSGVSNFKESTSLGNKKYWGEGRGRDGMENSQAGTIGGEPADKNR